jgi:hypothetical protein
MSPGSQLAHLQAQPFDVGSIAIDPDMAIILVHVGKNIVKDVLLDGGSSVNTITKDLKKKLRLLLLKLAPYNTLRMVD